jgi:hypothetical protein
MDMDMDMEMDMDMDMDMDRDRDEDSDRDRDVDTDTDIDMDKDLDTDKDMYTARHRHGHRQGHEQGNRQGNGQGHRHKKHKDMDTDISEYKNLLKTQIIQSFPYLRSKCFAISPINARCIVASIISGQRVICCQCYWHRVESFIYRRRRAHSLTKTDPTCFYLFAALPL